MKIYGFPTFNVTKVLFTAEELGLDYEYVALNPAQQEHKLPEHISRHPLGKVPALEHEGNYLFESAAICRYLAVVADSPMYGGSPLARAVIDEWVDMTGHHVGRWLAVHFFEEIVKPQIMERPGNQKAVAEAKRFLDMQLPAFDKRLGESNYLAGEQISIADTLGASFFTVTDRTSASIEAYPNLSRWYRELSSRPTFARAVSHYPET